MKLKISLFLSAVLLLVSCIVADQAIAATATYNITAGNLVNMPNNCGTAGPYSACSPGVQLGFNWSDGLPAGTSISSVQIQFRIGVDCTPGGKTWLMNNVVQGTTTTSGSCSCNITGTPVSTVNGNPSNYNVGGVNSFRLTTTSSCLGLYNNWSSGTVYGIVTVTYEVCSGWDLGTNSTNPAPLPSGCGWADVPLGSGSYEDVTIAANTWYDFDPPAYVSPISSMRVTPLNGNGSSFTMASNTNQNAWYSGTTTSIRISAYRNACWNSTSAILRYRRTTPTAGTVSVSPTSSCAGGTATFTHSGASRGVFTDFQYRWNASGSWNVNWQTSNPYNWTSTNGSDFLEVRARVSNNGCTSTTSSVTHQKVPDPTISSSGGGTICSGGSRTLSSSTSGGTGTCTYQWQVSTAGSGGPFSNISGATSSSYNTGALTATRWYRVVRNCTGSGCNDPVSNVQTVTVVADPTISTSGGGTICSGGSLTLSSSTSGGTGTCTYQWQVSTSGSGGPFSNISGATSSTYNTGALTATRWYRVVRNCNGSGCNDPASNVQTVTVVPDPTVSISGGGTVCSGGSFVLNATTSNGTGCSYQWQVSTAGSGGPFSNISGATGSSYNTGALTQTTWYRVQRICTGSGCSDPYSNVIAANVQNNGTAVGTWVGNVSSDWSDCRNWGGGVVPSGINVTIVNGSPNDPVISSSVPNVQSIYIQNGADLRVVAGGTVTTTAANFSGAGIQNNGYFQVSGGTVNVNSSGLRQFGNGNFTMSSGTVTLAGWLYNDAGDVNVQMNISGGTLNVNRIPNYAGVINHSGGVINCFGYYYENNATNGGVYNGSGTAVINFRGSGSGAYFRTYMTQTEFNDVNIYGTYTFNASATGLDVDGDFTIQAGGSFDANGLQMNHAGDWTNNGTFINDGNSVYFDGAGAQNINAGGTGAGKEFYNVYITNGGVVTLSSDMEVDRTFDVQGGTFTMTNRSLYTVNGVAGGVAQISAGATVVVNGASSQWRCSNGNNGVTNIYGLLTLNDGIVESGANITLHASGTINQSGGRFGTGDVLTVNGDYNGNGGVLQLWGGGDLYSGTLLVNNASAYFYNLEADDDGTNRCLISGSSQTVVVTNDFTILAGANLDANGVNINVGGNWVNNGAIQGPYLGFTSDNNTVTFTGSGNISGASKTSFFNVVNSAGARVQTTDTDVLNNLSVNAGQYTLNGGNTLSFANGAAATVANGASFRANGTASNIAALSSISGNYTFTVNGAMQAKYAAFSNMGGNGVDLSSATASLPVSSEDFDNCSFSNWSGSQALLLRDNLGIAGSTMSFVNATGTNISHVNPAASNALVTVTGAASGSRWGEAYDGESEGATFSQIDWADTYTFTVSGSDFGGGLPADGTYYYGNQTGNNAPGTSINAVAGSCGTGYTGTGSAPSGTGNSSPAFSITQNSTLTWNWDTPAASILWTGNVDDDWHNPANWSCYGIPTSSTTVVIDPANLTGAGASPVIHDDMVGECLEIEIVSGITIDIANDPGSGDPSPDATRLEVYLP